MSLFHEIGRTSSHRSDLCSLNHSYHQSARSHVVIEAEVPSVMHIPFLLAQQGARLIAARFRGLQLQADPCGEMVTGGSILECYVILMFSIIVMARKFCEGVYRPVLASELSCKMVLRLPSWGEPLPGATSHAYCTVFASLLPDHSSEQKVITNSV